MNTIKKDLIAAKELIDTPVKWRKDDRVHLDSCCAIIAVDRVLGIAAGRTPSWLDCQRQDGAWGALYDALPDEWRPDGEEEDDPGIRVGDYNDDPRTTHADIMALFDRAIAAQDGE